LTRSFGGALPCGGGRTAVRPYIYAVRGAHCRAPLHLRRAGGGALPCAPTFTPCGGGALPCAPTFTPCGGGALPCAPTFTPCGGGRTAVRPYIYAVRGGRTAVRPYIYAVRGAHCRAPLHLRRAGGGALPCAPTFTPCGGRPYLQPSPTFNLQLSTFPTSIPASIHFWYASNVPLK
jgi:hypothetical protein